MATQLSQKRALDQPSIPDRLYFKIGDVAKICDVQTYVLRFWETEFPQLKPNKSGTGQRLYRRRDVELALEIKRLVHAEGYTLAGARQVLEQPTRRPAPQAEPLRSPVLESAPELQPTLALASESPSQRRDTVASVIGHTRAELREIASMLASPAVVHPQRRRGRLAAISIRPPSLFPF